jgi:hypothetical protein
VGRALDEVLEEQVVGPFPELAELLEFAVQLEPCLGIDVGGVERPVLRVGVPPSRSE